MNNHDATNPAGIPASTSNPTAPHMPSLLAGSSGHGKNQRLWKELRKVTSDDGDRCLWIVDGKTAAHVHAPSSGTGGRAGAVRRRLDRARARRRYESLGWTLDQVMHDLFTQAAPDDRAALLDHAADLTTDLANLHTTAWGPEPDPHGHPQALYLHSQAWVLRQIARSERAVLGMTDIHDGTGTSTAEADGACDCDACAKDAWVQVAPPTSTGNSAVSVAETFAWARLAHTIDHAERAYTLRRLHDMIAVRLGDPAASALAFVADTEEHLAGHRPAALSLARRSRRDLARLYAVLGALIAVAVLNPPQPVRGLLAVAVVAIPAAVWWIGGRWEIRCTTNGQRLGSRAHRRGHLLPQLLVPALALMLVPDRSRGRCHPKRLRIVRRNQPGASR
ncbi:hypothetical protein [Actinomadura rudentiformis]|uniref:Uncharacterized protein n=1 Tax=Actinomadura rudentiformis TaxID=359158 RepID=A0A6H9YTB9_9ACTN|nr:hypothetical protein [Actinomadura rudentiformis]KAB2351610.1 hypothetical protein F8566_05135 [Actinomadura rudentiformis]